MTGGRRDPRSTTQRGYGWSWQVIRMQILERDRHICHYCGAPANTVDHVIPKIRGGSDDPSNLVAACGGCNSAKSDRAAPPRVKASRPPGWRTPSGMPVSRKWASDYVWGD